MIGNKIKRNKNSDVFPHQFPIIKIAEPGELKEEYERELEKVRLEREREEKKEWEASEALISKLKQEEEVERAKSAEYLNEIAKRDEEFAKELNNVMNEAGVDSPMGFLIGETKKRINTRSDSTNSTVSSGRPCSGPLERLFMNISHSASPSSDGKYRRSSSLFSDKSISTPCLDSMQVSRTNSKGSSSGLDVDMNNSLQNLQVSTTSRTSSSMSNKTEDSITQELSHFKPIEICPKTPPKKLANGKSVDPPLIRTTPINLNRAGFESPNEKTLSDIDASSPIMQRRLSELAEERKQHVKEFSKSTSTFSQPKNSSQKCLQEAKNVDLDSRGFNEITKNIDLDSRGFNEITKNVDVDSKGSDKIIGFNSENLILPYEVDLDLHISTDDSDCSQTNLVPERGKDKSKEVTIHDKSKPSGLRSPDIKDWLMGRFVQQDVADGEKSIILDCNDNDIITDATGDHKTPKQKRMKLGTKNSSSKENTVLNYFQSVSESRKKTLKRKMAISTNENEVYESDPPCLNRKKGKKGKNGTGNVISEDGSSVSGTKKCIHFSNFHENDLDHNRNNTKSLCVQTTEENTDVDSYGIVDQEEKDRLYALELQKRFELEVKYGVNADRIKGGANSYSFRNRPK